MCVPVLDHPVLTGNNVEMDEPPPRRDAFTPDSESTEREAGPAERFGTGEPADVAGVRAGTGGGSLDDFRDGGTPAAGAESVVRDQRIAFAGRLGGMNRREAANLLRSYGATVVDSDARGIDWVVIGAEESPLAEAELLDEATRRAAGEGTLEILHETELWHRLGLVDLEQSIRQYYTPAMLAHLLGVSVRVIRRWQRRGLITPVRTLHKLPYFDFQEVATARRLAQWVAAGASPEAIERRLAELVEVLPDIRRPLDQLSILVEGKQVLLRQGEGLIEPGGQLRFDFDAFAEQPWREEAVRESVTASVLSIADRGEDTFPTGESPPAEQDEWLAAAFEAEDRDDLATAIGCCHAILARDGARADICFQLGELLYRQGHPLAARERYYMALELDSEFVEARASLGGVLAETGQPELAVAAFRGTLRLCDDYPDVHYNLARTLDELGLGDEAEPHWRRFCELAPESPWAAEAARRLGPEVVSEDG